MPASEVPEASPAAHTSSLLMIAMVTVFVLLEVIIRWNAFGGIAKLLAVGLILNLAFPLVVAVRSLKTGNGQMERAKVQLLASAYISLMLTFLLFTLR